MRAPRAVEAVAAGGVLIALFVGVPAARNSGAGRAPVVAANPVQALANLLKNGSFEVGGTTLTPWIFRNDVAGTLGVDTTSAVDGARAAKVTVSATSPSAWFVQLRQEGLALRERTTYTVSFFAKAWRNG